MKELDHELRHCSYETCSQCELLFDMFDKAWHFLSSIIFRLAVKYIAYLFPHSIAFHSYKYVHDKHSKFLVSAEFHILNVSQTSH